MRLHQLPNPSPFPSSGTDRTYSLTQCTIIICLRYKHKPYRLFCFHHHHERLRCRRQRPGFADRSYSRLFFAFALPLLFEHHHHQQQPLRIKRRTEKMCPEARTVCVCVCVAVVCVYVRAIGPGDIIGIINFIPPSSSGPTARNPRRASLIARRMV